LLGWLPRADAGTLAYWTRKYSWVLFAAGAALILTRNPGLAVLAGMLAYSVTQKTGWLPGWGGQPRMGSISTVRTAYLEISLDHATGAMSGRALKGRFAGRELSSFSALEREGYLAELRASDAQGAQLFEAYLDRISPGWHGGAGASASQRGPDRGMGIEEAYLVLGLSPGASRADIQAAHRNLMKRFHPDQGGSTYLASKVNEAKDVLLKNVRG
jgi:DnaJ domain